MPDARPAYGWSPQIGWAGDQYSTVQYSTVAPHWSIHQMHPASALYARQKEQKKIQNLWRGKYFAIFISSWFDNMDLPWKKISHNFFLIGIIIIAH